MHYILKCASVLKLKIKRWIAKRSVIWNYSADHRLETISIADREVFVGYYDITPFKPSNDSFLALSVPKGAQARHDPADIVLFDVQAQQAYQTLTTTRSWAWQMGSRLRWQDDDSFWYTDKTETGYETCRFSLSKNNVVARFPGAFFEISRRADFALEIDMDRLQRLRPGYGYSNFPDTSQGQKAPKENGVWYYNLQTNEKKLLFSLYDVSQLERHESMAGAEHYFNHVSLSEDASKFMVFHLWEKESKRNGRALIYDFEEESLSVCQTDGVPSHYVWDDKEDLLLTIAKPDGSFSFEQFSPTTKWQTALPLEGFNFRRDGHPSYNPVHKNRMLFDSYPDAYSERAVYVFDKSKETIQCLAGFYSWPSIVKEKKCDLHPRFCREGKRILVDSAHYGYRVVVLIRSVLESDKNDFD